MTTQEIRTYLNNHLDDIEMDVCIDEDKVMIDGSLNINWGASNELDYTKQEAKIDSLGLFNDNYHWRCWYDVSGYKYWMLQQEESNYVNIAITLNKVTIDILDELIDTIEDVQNDLSSSLIDWTDEVIKARINKQENN